MKPLAVFPSKTIQLNYFAVNKPWDMLESSSIFRLPYSKCQVNLDHGKVNWYMRDYICAWLIYTRPVSQGRVITIRKIEFILKNDYGWYNKSAILNNDQSFLIRDGCSNDWNCLQEYSRPVLKYLTIWYNYGVYYFGMCIPVYTSYHLNCSLSSPSCYFFSILFLH